MLDIASQDSIYFITGSCYLLIQFNHCTHVSIPLYKMLLKAASQPISLRWPFSQAKETQGFVFHGSASSVQAPRPVLAPFLFPFSEELSSPGHPHLDSTSPWQPSSLLWSGFLDSTPCPPPPCDTPDLWCRQGKDWGLLQPLWLAVPSSQQELHVVLPKQPFTIFLKNILFIYLWPCPVACRILVLWPRIEPMAPCSWSKESQPLNR